MLEHSERNKSNKSIFLGNMHSIMHICSVHKMATVMMQNVNNQIKCR